MQISEEETKQVADAVIEEYAADMGALYGDWKALLRERIMKHLCPPPKLEWNAGGTGRSWISSGYIIDCLCDGQFHLYDKKGQYVAGKRHQFPTLAEAQAAAQKHFEESAK